MEIPNGKIFGQIRKSFQLHEYKAFEGIPYANSPMNENRFAEATPYEKKWTGVWNATSSGSPCLHFSQFIQIKGKYAIIGDEECLFVNVYTQVNDIKNKDVIVNIHAGGFQHSAGEGFGPDYLMDDESIVLVNFNYRLGPLGFLSTGDAIVPGNMGMKDQVLLLKWVQKNIAAFGGDPSKVTIVGLSAGGSSVHYMMLSPMAKGLFTKAISASGTALCSWALIPDNPQKTKKLASLVGCPTHPSIDMIQCMRERPAQTLVSQIAKFLVFKYNPFTVFGPMIETNSSNPFISEHPVDIIKSGRAYDVPWINSETSHEGLDPAAGFIFNSSWLYDLSMNWQKFAPTMLFFNATTPISKQGEIADKIRSHYMKTDSFPVESQDIISIFTEQLYHVPAAISAILHAQKNKKSPVFFYLYSRAGSFSVSSFLSEGNPKVIGAAHADDISLIFKLEKVQARLSWDDQRMGNILVNIYVTFAKTGCVPRELNWEPVPRDPKKFHYLHIKSVDNITMEKSPDFGNMTFFAKLFPNDKSFNINFNPLDFKPSIDQQKACPKNSS